jgi:predicted ATPase
MIESFHVKNFKALRDVAIALTPLHVLIGPNDSGKTSVLEALMALCRSVDFQSQDIFVGSWQRSQLVWQENLDLTVEFEAQLRSSDGSYIYRLGIRFPFQGRNPSIVREECLTEPDFVASPLLWHPHITGVSGCVNKQWEMNDAPLIKNIKAIYSALSGVQFYRWDPQFLALPVAPDSTRRFRMESNGFGLALCLDDILGYDREIFAKLESKFKEIFPQIAAIRLLPQPAYRTPHEVDKEVPLLSQADGKGLFFRFTGSNNDVPASQMSDGTLLVLAYLTILNLPEPPRVLLVEEPENGIHPKRLQEVLQILRGLVEKHSRTQILMTTHSPYVLDAFKPEEVTLCRREADGSTSVSRLSDSAEVRKQLGVFSLGEIWTGQGDEAIAQSARDGTGAGK